MADSCGIRLTNPNRRRTLHQNRRSAVASQESRPAVAKDSPITEDGCRAGLGVTPMIQFPLPLPSEREHLRAKLVRLADIIHLDHLETLCDAGDYYASLPHLAQPAQLRLVSWHESLPLSDA